MSLVEEKVKELFVAWDMQKDHQSLYLHLIKSNEDLNEFMKDFHTGNVTDIIKYQRHKRSSGKLNFEEFDVLFQEDKKDALEKLFHEPILEHQVEYMHTYRISQKELYRRFKENSNLSYLNIVKSAKSIQEIINDDFLLSRF